MSNDLELERRQRERAANVAAIKGAFQKLTSIGLTHSTIGKFSMPFQLVNGEELRLVYTSQSDISLPTFQFIGASLQTSNRDEISSLTFEFAKNPEDIGIDVSAFAEPQFRKGNYMDLLIAVGEDVVQHATNTFPSLLHSTDPINMRLYPQASTAEGEVSDVLKRWISRYAKEYGFRLEEGVWLKKIR